MTSEIINITKDYKIIIHLTSPNREQPAYQELSIPESDIKIAMGDDGAEYKQKYGKKALQKALFDQIERLYHHIEGEKK